MPVGSRRGHSSIWLVLVSSLSWIWCHRRICRGCSRTGPILSQAYSRVKEWTATHWPLYQTAYAVGQSIDSRSHQAAQSPLFRVHLISLSSGVRIPKPPASSQLMSSLSFLRAAIRTSLQSNFYASQNNNITATVIVGSFVIYLWCVLAHLFGAVPQPGIYSEGFNHGGLFIDFIGQRWCPF